MQPIASPHIEAVGYDAATQRMHLRFRAGELCPSYTLEYIVTPEQWAEMQPARYLTYRPYPVRLLGSKGRWR